MSFQVRHLGVRLTIAGAVFAGMLALWESSNRHMGTVYADQLAGGEPTVCNGVTNHTSPYPVVVGDYWPREKCAEAERIIAERIQMQLLDCIRRPIPQPVFDALSSHAWNFSPAETCGSESVKAINDGDIRRGCDLLAHQLDGSPNWSSVKTGRTLPDGRPEYRFVQGLYNRRLAERALCLEGAG